MVAAPTANELSQLITVGRLGPDSWRAHDAAFGDCVLIIHEPEELEARRRVLRLLDHPRTRKELAVVTVPGRGQGLVTTFLPGMPLSSFDRRKTMSRPGEAMRVGLLVLDILVHAHERGVVHGAIAKRHVLVTDESASLVGFTRLSADDPQADLRALAAILYELVTDQPWKPFAPPASQLNTQLGADFDDWMEVITGPDAAFRDADHARSALQAVAAKLPDPSRAVERAWF